MAGHETDGWSMNMLVDYGGGVLFSLSESLGHINQYCSLS